MLICLTMALGFQLLEFDVKLFQTSRLLNAAVLYESKKWQDIKLSG